MLSTIPLDRMLPCVADATPKNCLFTEPMMALVLGEAKNDTPRPDKTSGIMINHKGVPSFKKVSSKTATKDNDIPRAATFLGSNLSDSRPAKGEKKTMTTDMMTSISPASDGEYP